MLKWFLTLLSGRPHFYIGGQEDPYLLRWYLVPRNPWFRLFLHKFLRDDDDRALHDHPWWYVSLVVKGSYLEYTNGGKSLALRRPFSLAFHLATHRHRIELFRAPNNGRIPCWTIVLAGRKSRLWGFWCQHGFVPWYEFVAENDKSIIGKGCGDDH